MLKLILSLFADWAAYRRAIAWGEPTPRCWTSLSFCDVSIWPVDAEPTGSPG